MLKKIFLWISLLCFFALAIDLPLYSQANQLRGVSREQGVRDFHRHRDMDDILREMREVLRSDISGNEKKERVKVLLEELKGMDRRVREGFKETEEFLKEKGLPEEIIKRHREFVESYEKRYKELMGRVNAYLKGRWFSERGLRGFLEKSRYKKRLPRIEPNRLPHRLLPEKKIPTERYRPVKRKMKKIELTPEGKKLMEELKRKEGKGTPEDKPTGESSFIPVIPHVFGVTEDTSYLSETMEVQFTPEVESLAKELGYMPVKIYEYLRNNFDYEPYYGSLKGSQQTLYEKAGNDFDLASLLIALLRVSGIKARYVYGEIIVPIDRVKGWFGVNDPWVAGNILVTSGIPARMLIVDGRPWGIRLEHCWVEAYIPYEGSKVYRGAYDPRDIGRARWMWVPMDVSYKEYRYVEKIDVSGVSFNEDEYLDTLRDESPFDYYFKEIEGFIKDNYPDSSVFHGVALPPFFGQVQV